MGRELCEVIKLTYLSSNGKTCGVAVMTDPMLGRVKPSSDFGVADKAS